MIYVGPDTDRPAQRFRIDRTYHASEILSEDPQAFFHVWHSGGGANNILFAVVRRPDNVHLRSAGFSFEQLDNGLFLCTGLGVDDYYTWNESRDVRLADFLEVLHGSQRASGSVLDAMVALERFDIVSEVDGSMELENSDNGDWVRYEDVADIIDQLRTGDLRL